MQVSVYLKPVMYAQIESSGLYQSWFEPKRRGAAQPALAPDAAERGGFGARW
jgi:hypothetical protein